MIIRQANKDDYIHIARSLQNKKIAYNTPAHIKEDINCNRLYIAIENNKIIAQCALVHETRWNYTAIKRLCVYNKRNHGKGIANLFIQFFINEFNCALGATPWEENAAMKHLLEKNGFEYQYTFSENYQFYLLTK